MSTVTTAPFPLPDPGPTFARNDLALRAFDETWPADLQSLWRQCDYAFHLFIEADDFALNHPDSAEARALTVQSYQLWKQVEALAAPVLVAYERSRDRSRQVATGRVIRVAHPDKDGAWLQATVHEITGCDVIVSLRRYATSRRIGGLRHVDWTAIHPDDRAALEAAR